MNLFLATNCGRKMSRLIYFCGRYEILYLKGVSPFSSNASDLFHTRSYQLWILFRERFKYDLYTILFSITNDSRQPTKTMIKELIETVNRLPDRLNRIFFRKFGI